MNAPVNLDATRHSGKRYFIEPSRIRRETTVLATLAVHDQRPGQGRQLAQAICYIDDKWVTHNWQTRCLSCRRVLKVQFYLERIEPWRVSTAEVMVARALSEILPNPKTAEHDTIVQARVRFESKELYSEIIRVAESGVTRTRVFRCPRCGQASDTRLFLERTE